jgi:SsrA-binding protein
MTAKKKKPNATHAPTIFNRKAKFEYEFLDEYEAGIVLTGTEVKSLRAGKANIQDAFANEKNTEIWLHNLHISEYSEGNINNHTPKRPRKLLLHKKEIRKLIGTLQEKGLTLIPLQLFFNDKGKVKVKLIVGRGKKAHDKRATEKDRDWQRQKSRIMKHDV